MDNNDIAAVAELMLGREKEVLELLKAAFAFKLANEAWSAAFSAACQRVGNSALLLRPGALDELAPEAVPLVEESNRCHFRLTKAAMELPR